MHVSLSLSIIPNWQKGHPNLHCHLTSLIHCCSNVNVCPNASRIVRFNALCLYMGNVCSQNCIFFHR